MSDKYVDRKALMRKSRVMKDEDGVLIAKCITCADIDSCIVSDKEVLLSVLSKEEIEDILDKVVNGCKEYNGKDDLVNGYIKKLRDVISPVE